MQYVVFRVLASRPDDPVYSCPVDRNCMLVSVSSAAEAASRFDSFDEAAALALSFNAVYGGDDQRFEVRLADGAEWPAEDWQLREKLRFCNGVYDKAPWHDEPWYQVKHEELFCHLSRKQPGQVAFTENAAKGMADRQTPSRPGRFLNRFFGDVLTNEQIEQWCAKLSVKLAEDDLKITQDADEIEDVYVGGPSSCMKYPASSFAAEHPTRVYAGPDLALAYIGSRENAKGRCVVWPEKKLYGRVYGDVSRLELMLKDAGYERCHSGFSGARIQRIETDDGFVMPYVDEACDGAADTGDYLVLGQGNIETQVTNGESVERPTCPRCGDPMRDQYTVDDETWCSDCYYNDTAICEHFGERYPVSAGFTTVYSMRRGWSGQTYRYEATICDDNLDAYGAVYVEEDGEYWLGADTFFCPERQENCLLANAYTGGEVPIHFEQAEELMAAQLDDPDNAYVAHVLARLEHLRAPQPEATPVSEPVPLRWSDYNFTIVRRVPGSYLLTHAA